MTTVEQKNNLALNGIRVLEIGTGYAVAYAGKIFSDFGAEVIKAESPEGDELRNFPPLLNAHGEVPQSGLNAWLNTNKKSVTFNDTDTEDLTWISWLASTCDVILDSRALTKGVDVLRRPVHTYRAEYKNSYPPIEVFITWFGETGPYSKFLGSDAICRSLAGAVYGSGELNGPPQLPHDIQTGIVAGLAAFSSAIAALIGASDGSRRYVISVHEAAFSVVEMEAGMVQDGRHLKSRLGINRFCTTHPGGIYQTKSGWIGLFGHTVPQWTALCESIGFPEYANDPRFVNGPARMKHADEVEAFLLPALMKRTALEWFELLGNLKFPVVLVPTMDELLKQKVHRERGAFVLVQSGSNHFEGVTIPFPLGEAGPLKGGAAPGIGADNEYYRSEKVFSKRPRYGRAATGLGPLRKLRVIDLTMGWAGPLATRTLADFGADVIKVESTKYPDWWRGAHYTDEFYREKLYEKNSNFALMNRNKMGITLDLTSQEGRDILLELIKTADIVIENYSAEVLPKLGLDYPVLSSVNSRLVMISMPAFGIDNEWSHIRAYGGTLEQASGLAHHTGFPDHPPCLTSYAYGDPIGGWNAGAAALLSLFIQRLTGKGRHVNLSQVECMLPLVSPFLIEQSIFGFTRPRQGNSHPIYAPHHIYPCAGDDEWVVLSVLNDSQWIALTDLIQAPQLKSDPALGNTAGRHAHKERINAIISAWTILRSSEDCMYELQNAGVCAAVVKPVWQTLEDIHLRSRGVFTTMYRKYLGEFLATTPIFREYETTTEVVRPAPTLGEHSQEIFKKLLGLTDEKIRELEEKGITGTLATSKSTRH